jgi:hypothetical protein
MSNVYDIKDYNKKKHVYELDNCSGCKKTIKDNELYTEVVMEMSDNVKKHIAFCKQCANKLEKEGFI